MIPTGTPEPSGSWKDREEAGLAQALVPLAELEVRIALERDTLAETPIGRLLMKIEEEALKSRPEQMIMKGTIGTLRRVPGPPVD